MGRNSTGAVHHFHALKLSMKFLKEVNPSKIVTFNKTMEWNFRGEYWGAINYDISFKEGDRYLRLRYAHTDHNGQSTSMDYKIRIIGIPSNLGKGENLYFVCPTSFKLCKILYKCYDSQYFMCRDAYSNRIYYTSQMYSKADRVNNYYFELNNEIEDLKMQQIKQTYKNVETRLQKRITKLELKREEFDFKRLNYFLKGLL